MALELTQQLKLAQQLVMTPQLQQAIKLLQLSRLELEQTVQQELEINPLLEEVTAELEMDAEGDLESPSNEIEPVQPHIERTPELTFESPSTLSEVNWNDYANEYGNWAQASQTSEDSNLPSRLDIASNRPNLSSHLRWQLFLSHLTEQEFEVGDFIIGNLNRDGFLEVNGEEIINAVHCDREMAEKMILKIQDMDPAGVGARNVQESLLLQLKRLNLENSLAALIVRDHLPQLETKNYAAIAKVTKASREDICQAIKIIVGLDPRPGRVYSDEQFHYIIPDVYVHKVDDEYIILLNDDGLPRLRVSSYYQQILQNKGYPSDQTKQYIQEKLRAAVWLIKSIQQRQRTIFKVVGSIIKFQRDFFDKGISFLKPMVLRDVALDINMHESTISRVTTNKYVHTPQGIFELKYFFNSAIQRTDREGDALASESVKERIRHIIQGENPQKTLSDKSISEIFHGENIKLARRTVAKYREQLGILPSNLRKQPDL